MAKLSDVAYSQNGDQQTLTPSSGKSLEGIVQYKKDEEGNVIYPTSDSEWVIFKLVQNTKEGGTYIPNVDDVYNPATKVVERIRLLSGVNTIWQKDQKDLPKEYIDRNGRNIEFPRKVKIRRVRKIDATMLEFMRICNFNVGNPNRIAGNGRFEFFEYDGAAAEKEAYEKESFELEVALLAKGEKPEPMRKHAAFLGIRLINDLGEKKTDDGIRKDYVMYAKRNPHYFKQTMNTPQIEISWLVRKAIADSFIEIGREPLKIYWANGGGMIGVHSQTENPQDYLTNLAMTNSEEGKRFLEDLKKVAT